MRSALVPQRRRAHHGLTGLEVGREPPAVPTPTMVCTPSAASSSITMADDGCAHWETREAQLRGELQYGTAGPVISRNDRDERTRSNKTFCQPKTTAGDGVSISRPWLAR